VTVRPREEVNAIAEAAEFEAPLLFFVAAVTKPSRRITSGTAREGRVREGAQEGEGGQQRLQYNSSDSVQR